MSTRRPTPISVALITKSIAAINAGGFGMRALTPDRSVFFIGVISCVAALVVPGFAVGQAPTEWDGLVQRRSSSVDLLYVRPEASLAGYKRVRLAPLQVAFDRNWNPNATRRGANRLTSADFERIRTTLAETFATTAASELARGGYNVVTEAGEDVLDVTPFIVNLVITAPDTMTPGVRTFTANAGRMTLVAELRDSETGQILARVVDNQRARSTGTFQLATSVSNVGAARQIIARWASILRRELDAANGR
jgi:hypothetical protein